MCVCACVSHRQGTLCSSQSLVNRMQSGRSVVLVLVLSSFAALTAAQVCFSEGEWEGCIFIGEEDAADAVECYGLCQAESACNFFTFYENAGPAPNECRSYSQCDEFSPGTCSNCISGERSCEGPTCDVLGRCIGVFVDGGQAETYNQCLEMCKIHQDCEWFTFDETEYFCSMTFDCISLDDSCKSCRSGQRTCSKRYGETKF